ncbi:phosphatidylinositol 3,4,5-trisphosphate 3-phosphatase TPTE2-like [Thomomys bottae]
MLGRRGKPRTAFDCICVQMVQVSYSQNRMTTLVSINSISLFYLTAVTLHPLTWLLSQRLITLIIIMAERDAGVAQRCVRAAQTAAESRREANDPLTPENRSQPNPDEKKHYFSDFLNITDAAITIIILFMDITYIFFNATFFKDIQRMIVFFRLLRLITLMRIFHLATQKRHLEKLIRRLVSGNKRRYAKDGFDLDLTYITDRLVAMSFPSSGIHTFYRNPMQDSIDYFGEHRTDRNVSSQFQGVETPSQSRYVRYFDILKNVLNWEMPVKKPLKIVKFVIYSIQGVGEGNGADLKIEIIMQHKTVFTCTRQTCTVVHDIDTNRAIFLVPNCPDLCDDIKVKFSSSKLPNYYDDCAFFMWFHTSLIEKNRLYLTRADLDNPHKEKTWNIYRPDFAVDIFFEEVFQ